MPPKSGNTTQLRCGVAQLFEDPLSALRVLGGLDMSFVSKLMRESNGHILKHKERGHNSCCPHEPKWEDFQCHKMHCFLGIVLTISISPVDGGGCVAHFGEKNQQNLVQFVPRFHGSEEWPRFCFSNCVFSMFLTDRNGTSSGR